MELNSRSTASPVVPLQKSRFCTLTEQGPTPSPDPSLLKESKRPRNEVREIFQRGKPRPAKGQKIETSDQEKARLKTQGVDGISKPLYLGVDGTDVILPPMKSDEELLSIPLTNNKCTQALI